MSESDSVDPFDILQDLLLEMAAEMEKDHQILADLVARVEKIEKTLNDS